MEKEIAQICSVTDQSSHTHQWTRQTFLQAILIWSLITFEPPSYGGIQFPVWGLTLGWCMAMFVLLWIPGIAVYKLMKVKGNPWKVCLRIFPQVPANKTDLNGFLFPQRLKRLCSPSEEWHPYLDVHRGERYSKERCSQTENCENKLVLNVISNSRVWFMSL